MEKGKCLKTGFDKLKKNGDRRKDNGKSKETHQNTGNPLDGLDKYFENLPLLEEFLKENDPQHKKDNGIFFTPLPVVSFIVRSINQILKEKLDKPLGLADETVKVLDPAAGTGVFLIAAARMAIHELTRKYGKEKANDLARKYMMNNLFGMEKDMSLHTIANLNISHFFQSFDL